MHDMEPKLTGRVGIVITHYPSINARKNKSNKKLKKGEITMFRTFLAKF